MKLESLPKIVKKRQKRVGRGAGSGRAKTAGRGTKGQNARGKLSITHPHYEGGQRPLFKRLPYRRGKGNAKISKKPIVVNLKALNILAKNSEVDLEALIKSGIVDKNDAKVYGVKILGDGDINVPLTINLPISKSAAKKIEKSGGKVVINQSADKKAIRESTENKQQAPNSVTSKSSVLSVITKQSGKVPKSVIKARKSKK